MYLSPESTADRLLAAFRAFTLCTLLKPATSPSAPRVRRREDVQSSILSRCGTRERNCGGVATAFTDRDAKSAKYGNAGLRD
jgi:hypothetical protein